MDLDSSITSIIKAQNEAKKLEFQNKILKIGYYSLGVVAIGIGGYLGGKAIKLW